MRAAVLTQPGKPLEIRELPDPVALDAFPETFEALKRPTTQCKVVLEP